MRFVNKRGFKKMEGKKKKKNSCFVRLKNFFFFFLLFSHYSFFLAFERWFLKLWSNTPLNILNHSKWSTNDEDINNCFVMGRPSLSYLQNRTDHHQWYHSRDLVANILRQKKNYGNSNISPCKNIPNLQKIF